MKFLDLGKKDDLTGRERPGTISIYLVRLPNGEFLRAELRPGEVISTPDWSKAAFYFLAAGMLEAKDIAQRLHGEVCIVSCTPVEKYRG